MAYNFKELLKQKAKEGKILSDEEAKGKMSVLDEMDDIIGEKMSDKVKGLKKVSVAAPNQEGLEEGLDLAKNVVESGAIDKMESEDEMEDESDMADMSKEEIMAKIEELKQLLESKMEMSESNEEY